LQCLRLCGTIASTQGSLGQYFTVFWFVTKDIDKFIAQHLMGGGGWLDYVLMMGESIITPSTFHTHTKKNKKFCKKNPEQQLSYPGLLISFYSFV
jgi:hypothetical protein